MCLAIPGKIKKIEGSMALFDYNDHEYAADISLVSDPQVGDWILMHDGRAMSKINEDEATENLQFIEKQESEHNHSHNG